MSATAIVGGSAMRWGPLWGARPRDWAMNEEQQLPTYEEALRRLELPAGRRVLEVGCGTGVFLRAAAERGLAVVGLDASPALLDLARERVPDAELHVGDMEALPFSDGTFDAVAGFNCFFFADDLVAALREAGRVAKRGAPVVIQVWGRPDHCDLEAMKNVARRYLPPPPASASPPPPLWQPGVLEGLATHAGLVPRTTFDISWSYAYPDDDTVTRALLSVGGIASIADPAEEADVRAEILEAVAPYRTPDGGYRLENEFHFLIASAWGRAGEGIRTLGPALTRRVL
jgi:SAM-dependent methyltransferase